MSRAGIALAGLVVALVCAAGGYGFGIADGKAKAVATSNAETVLQLRDTLGAHVDLVKQSNRASVAMRVATAERQAQDAKTSEDFREALKKTAGDRAGCVFPADVVRQLSDAHARAASAAARGVRGALPAADAGAGK